MRPRVLAINPGSTSTKVSLFEGTQCVRSQSLHHDVAELKGLRLIDQLPMRLQKVREFISGEKHLDAVVGRGGLLHPLKSGAYVVNDDMLSDLREARYGEHASNLGAFLAHEISLLYQTRIGALVVDPVVVDEMDEVARVSGLPGTCRKSLFHALNQKAVARRVSRELGKPYESTRLVVAHMGGGVTVGAHREGRVVDVNDGLFGDGPMSPERAGGLPSIQLINLCFQPGMTLERISRRLVGEGGFVAHLGTNDFLEIQRRAATDAYASLIVDAFAYQVAKEIGKGVAVLSGKVDAIVLTGGLARSESLCSKIRARVDKFGMVVVYPGEDEMLALVEGALRVLEGQEQPLVYERWPA